MLRPFSFRAYCRQEDDFKEADMLQSVLGSDGQMRQTLGKPGFDWLFNKH